MHKHVLDHGYVRLVNHMGDDLEIVRAARQSYDAAWRAGENTGSDERLINYLLQNAHTTPFEVVEFQFAVRAPIFVARQWMRHRTWTYNELSGRYREMPELFYVPEPELIGTQSVNNKQVRDIGEPNPALIAKRKGQIDSYEMSCRADFTIYKQLLTAGWPREIARAKLPLSTYTDFFAKVDLHNLLHFLTLRLHEHAQYEIREYAAAIGELIEPIVPVTIAAWKQQENTKINVREIIKKLETVDGYEKEQLVADLRAAAGIAV